MRHNLDLNELMKKTRQMHMCECDYFCSVIMFGFIVHHILIFYSTVLFLSCFCISFHVA